MVVDAPTIDPFEAAQDRLNSGQALTQADGVLLDRFMGNGDGTFNQADRDRITADREDHAFLGGMRETASAAVTYGVISVAAQDITHPHINTRFEDAALGRTPAPAPEFTPTPGFSGPTGNVPGMDLGLNNFMPRPPSGGFGA